MKTATMLAACFIAASIGSAPAQTPGDHYPEAAIALAAQKQESFLNFVRLTYFAMGCKVFFQNDPGLMEILINTFYIDLGYPDIPNAVALVAAAKRDGAAKAAQGCDYWRQNPDAVLHMRSFVDYSARHR